MDPLGAARRLARTCASISFGPPVEWTYHPLTYAWNGYEQYVRRFGSQPKRLLLVGMNPGPWGMGQTGVPFGDPTVVREWMGIRAIKVDQPAGARPERPVRGLDAPRGEVSGTRLYGALRDGFGSLEAGFAHLFVANYCPVLFFGAGARNVTPDKLGKQDEAPLFAACDEHLAALVHHYRPTHVIGVGKFAEARARAVAEARALDVDVKGVPHPSPANPLANEEGGARWKRLFIETLARAGVRPSVRPDAAPDRGTGKAI